MIYVRVALDWHASSASSPGKWLAPLSHWLSTRDRQKAVVATKAEFRSQP